MAGLLSALPAPVQSYSIARDESAKPAQANIVQREAPPYLRRQGWVPRTQEDFGGGGAFPEIHVAQYPLDLGRTNRAAASTAIVPVRVDQEGNANFGAIVTQGRQDQIVHTKFSDLVEKDASKVIQPRPDQDADAAAAARTKAALEGIVSHKLSAARPGNVPANAVSRPEDARIIRYVPDADAPGYNPAAQVRIIKMVEAAVDPLEPPKFKHKKVPGGPPDAPVPVMHSPPRKVTVADQAAWKIPVCVSNWKTNRGFVVPLDKRVGADGRGLVEPTINDSFAKLSEALTIAERKARVEVETRAAIQRKLALRAKEEKESELRALAARARLERAGVVAPGGATHAGAGAAASSAPVGFEGEQLDESQGSDGEGSQGAAGSGWGGEREAPAGRAGAEEGGPMHRQEGESAEDYKARMERDRIRLDRKREREAELRFEAAGGRKGKAARDADRDMSERIALGQAAGKGSMALSGEGLYDARLFNQAAAGGGMGVGGGYGGEDEYSAYDAPWRGRGARGEAAVAAAVYRPRSGKDGVLSDIAAAEEVEVLRANATKRFRGEDNSTGFGGAGGAGGGVDFEGVAAGGEGRAAAPPRSGPVQFERAVVQEGLHVAGPDGAADDPFGIDSILGGAGGGGAGAGAAAGARRTGAALDSIGTRGGGVGLMRAGAGGGSRTAADLAGSGRNTIQFTSGGYTH